MSGEPWLRRWQDLIDEGWTRTDDPVDGVLQAPTDSGDDYISALIHRDGTYIKLIAAGTTTRTATTRSSRPSRYDP